MLDSIGGEKVIASGVAVWDGKSAVRDKAPDLQTTFTLVGRPSGGQVRGLSNQGTIDVELPGDVQGATAGAGSAFTNGKSYRVSWSIERIGTMLKLSYTIVDISN